MEALEVDPSDCLFALEVESSRALHATGGVFAPWYICSGIVFFFLSLVTFTLARPVAAREGGREGGRVDAIGEHLGRRPRDERTEDVSVGRICRPVQNVLVRSVHVNAEPHPGYTQSWSFFVIFL